MRTRRLASAAVLVPLLLSTTAQSEPLTWLIRGGVDVGGEKLVTVGYADGFRDDTRAGDGAFFALGASYAHSPTWESTLTLGYKVTGTDAVNGDLTLDSWPLELMTFHRTARWRIGGGVSFVKSPELDGAGALRELQLEFKDASGFVAEWHWFGNRSERLFLGARVNLLDLETRAGAEINGTSFGLLLGYEFR